LVGKALLPLSLVEPDVQISRIRLSCKHLLIGEEVQVLRFLIELPSQLMQLIRQQIHLDVVDVEKIPVGNPVVDW